MASDLCSGSFAFDSQSINLLAVSALTSLMILIVSYIFYRINGDEKIKVWVREEFWNMIFNGIVIVILLGVVALFKSNATSLPKIDNFMTSLIPGASSISSSGVKGSCLYQASYSYSISILTTALAEMAKAAWSSLHLFYLTNISKTVCVSDSFLVCLLGAPSVFIYPFADLRWVLTFLFRFQNILFTTVLLFAFSQAVLIKIFVSSNFFAFLSLMIIMRLIPFTRTFANVIFALIFSFLIFYPMLIILEAYILGVPNFSNTDAIPISITQASSLSEVRYGDDQTITKLFSTDDRIWRVEGDGTSLTLKKEDEVIFNFSQMIIEYSRLLFTVVLFGSINLIAVSLILRALLKMVGETNNLMEMFIRMSGVITW